jgi:type I restriction enzyme, S subunit
MIPGWQIKLLGEVCNKITDGSHNPPKGVVNSEFMMLSSKNIFDDFIHYNEPRYLTEYDFENENKRTNIQYKDVLLTIVGTIGRVATVPEFHPNFTLQRSVAVLRANENILNSRFLMYLLQNNLKYLTDEARGVAQKGIYLNQLRNIEISFPSLQIQEQVVTILDEAFAAIDKAKVNAEKNLKNAKELFESFLQGVFENKGEGWEERRLQDITVIDSPITYGVVKPGMEGEVKFVRGGDLQKGRILVNQLRTISLDISNQYKRTLLKGGELLICLVGMPGQTGIVPIELNGANIARQVGLIRLEKEYSAKFYNYYFQSKQGIKKLGLEESGAVQRVINLAALRNILVPIISISEQQRIVQNLEAFSSETERLVSIYQQKLTDLEELKRSILQKAFNGELNTADLCV